MTSPPTTPGPLITPTDDQNMRSCARNLRLPEKIKNGSVVVGHAWPGGQMPLSVRKWSTVRASMTVPAKAHAPHWIAAGTDA